MNEDELICAVRRRAEDPRTRTDYADRGCPDLAPPALAQDVDIAESNLGFPLHPLHRRLLTEVGNGGFGPGDGLIGLPGGRLDGDGRSLVELRAVLWTNAVTAGLPPHVLALCDWGDAIWSCMDEQTGHVLTLDEGGLTDTGQNLHDWLAAWVTGTSLFSEMFTFKERMIINPFTKQPMTVRTPARALGEPYRPTS